MLTRASVLNLAWHARNREIPVIGGDPQLERDSAAYVRGQGNVLRSLPRLTPRFELVKPNGSSLFIPAMLLEPARVNRMFPPDFSSWTNTNVTVTSGQPDTRGGLGAYLLNATSAAGHRDQAVTVVGDGTKTVSAILRKGSAAVPVFGLWDANGGGSWLGAVAVTWDADGRPVLSQSAGTVDDMYFIGPLPGPAGNEYWLCVGVIPSVTASHSNQGRIYPGGVAGTGSTYVDHFQVEDGAFGTSPIDSSATAAGIRTVDKFHWNAGPPVGNLLIYGEYIYANDKSVAPWRFVRGAAGGAHLGVFHNSDGTFRMTLHNGSSASTLITADIEAEWNDRIEYAALIMADRSARVIARVNKLEVFDDDAAVGATVTHPAAFTTEDVWLNGYETSNVGASRYSKLMAVKPTDMVTDPLTGDAQTVMAELDSFSDKLFFGETI